MACIESRTCILSTPFITVYDMTMVGHSIGKRVFWFGLAWAMLCNCNLHFWWGNIFMVSRRSSSTIDQLSGRLSVCASFSSSNES